MALYTDKQLKQVELEGQMKLLEGVRYRATKGSKCETILKGDVIRRSGKMLLNSTAGGFLPKGEWENIEFEAELDTEAERKAWERVGILNGFFKEGYDE